jgi:hypothetical protein
MEGLVAERTLCRGDRAPRILLVGHSDAANDLTSSGSDDVHHLAAVRFNERPVDVVRGDRLLSRFSSLAICSRNKLLTTPVS